MVGDRESTSVRCSRDRLKITICGNDNNTENLQDARKSSVYMPKNDESLYHGVTPSFSLLWVSADHVLVKGLGSNRDQFLPPSLLQTVNETYEQGTTDTKSRSGQEGFMSLQSDNNYKIEIGEKKSFTLQQGSVISIIYVFHTNHILIFVAFDNLERSSLRSGLSSVWMKHADCASQEGRRYVIPWLHYLDFAVICKGINRQDLYSSQEKHCLDQFASFDTVRSPILYFNTVWTFNIVQYIFFPFIIFFSDM